MSNLTFEPTRHCTLYTSCPLKTPTKTTNYKTLVPIIMGALLALSGFFLLLTAANTFPFGLNSLSTTGGYILGGTFGGVGTLFILLGVILRFCSSKLTPSTLKESDKKAKENSQSELNPSSSPISEEESSESSLPPLLISKATYAHFSSYHTTKKDKACAYAQNTSFFFYNCDEVKDYKWGCAWRCMQMIASSLKLFPSFEELYAKYRINPSESNEWAEPGYAKRHLDDLGVASEIILYKKATGTSKTPTEWCHKMADFPALRDKMVEHFQTYRTPIMADNVTFSLNIVGIRVTAEDETILFIADPHKTDKKSGLYYVVLDKEGKQVATTGVDDGKNGLKTAKIVDFATKGWMLLFPQPSLT